LPPVKERLSTMGYDIAASGPDELGAIMKSDTEMWGGVIQKAAIAKIE
jgi:hypothetical protein